MAQPKTPPRPVAPHLQRALQAKSHPAAARPLAAHVAAALPPRPAAPAAPKAAQAKLATRPAPGGAKPVSIQPCSAFLHWITCGCLGSPAPQSQPLLGSGGPSVNSSASSVSLVVQKPQATKFLDQNETGLVAYGGRAANSAPTTSCGLVILHTAGAQAVGFHWPFCSGTSTHKATFDAAIGTRVGTSIDVVVNGNHYKAGDAELVKFGRYLAQAYGLTVRVYRQVFSDGESGQVEPFIQVNRGGVAAAVPIHDLVAVAI